MRVLFTTTPGRGHYLAMVPLAAACRDRGHEVLWATADAACAGLRERDFDAVAVGLPAGATSGDLAARFPELMRLPARERAGAFVPQTFGPDRAGPMLRELLPLVREWEPSLLVCDTCELAGPVAAAVTGIPNATHAVGQPLWPEQLQRVDAAMAPLWRAHGLEPRPYGGLYEHLYLDIYPPSLRTNAIPTGTSVQSVRSVPILGGDRNSGEPLVYVTFGTVFSRALSAHRTVLEGIADLPIRVLVTTGPGADPADLGKQPPNVDVAAFVPQSEILPFAAALVSHGGSGTFLGALATGVPQVIVPLAADQFLNADAGATAGAAISIDPEALDAAAVREALLRILDDPAHAAAAARVQSEMRAMPAPTDAVVELERLAERLPAALLQPLTTHLPS